MNARVSRNESARNKCTAKNATFENQIDEWIVKIRSAMDDPGSDPDEQAHTAFRWMQSQAPRLLDAPVTFNTRFDEMDHALGEQTQVARYRVQGEAVVLEFDPWDGFADGENSTPFFRLVSSRAGGDDTEARRSKTWWQTAME